jgi:hypothetical protein
MNTKLCFTDLCVILHGLGHKVAAHPDGPPMVILETDDMHRPTRYIFFSDWSTAYASFGYYDDGDLYPLFEWWNNPYTENEEVPMTKEGILALVHKVMAENGKPL